MTVSSLLITLEPRTHDSTIRALSNVETLTLGTAVEQNVPAVLDTPSVREDRNTVRFISELPGVIKVDVLSIFFEGADDEAPLGGHHD